MEVHLNGWEAYAAFFLFALGWIHFWSALYQYGWWLGRKAWHRIRDRGSVIHDHLYAAGGSRIALWDGEKWTEITETRKGPSDE